MRIPRWTAAVLAASLYLLVPTTFTLAADDDAQPAASKAVPGETFAQIDKEFQDVQQAFMQSYRAAKDDAERQKLVQEKYPRPEKYAGRYLAFAEQHPDDPAAIDALARVVSYSRSGEPFDKALALLTGRFVESERLADVCQQLVYSGDAQSRAALATILEKNPHRVVKARACYALADWDMNRGNQAEAEKRFEEVIERYADAPHYRGTLGDAAKAQLFEIRNLGIGKPAPEIEGQDVDGKTFKLSEYRGKVVVLDFWGDW